MALEKRFDLFTFTHSPTSTSEFPLNASNPRAEPSDFFLSQPPFLLNKYSRDYLALRRFTPKN
jgi:hypothetical protein